MTYKVRARVGLLIWLLGISLLLAYLITQLRIVSDMGQFMPAARQDPQLQALMSEIQNGPAATTLMIRLRGAETAELAELSIQLRQKLSAQDEVIREVRNGGSSMDWDAVEGLFPYRYLLSEKIDWSSTGLHNTFEQRLTELRSGAGAMLSDFLVTDPQLAFLQYLHGLFDITGPVIKHGVWFDKNKQSALMLVHVRSETLELDIMQRAVDNIRSTFAALPSASTAQLEIAGPGIMAVETRAAIEQVLRRLTVSIVVLLTIVFAVAYRNLRLLWWASFPLISAILVALTVTQIVFDAVHSIVLAFGITLLGVCLDYPLHLFSHLRDGETPSASLDRIWPTLRLGGISSVLAFLALLGSGFDGLSQLAIFAACGLTVALAVTRYILPYWLSSDRINPRLWSVRVVLGVKQRIFVGMLLLSMPVLFVMQSAIFWETSIEAISPVPASARESDHTLRHELNVPEVSHVFWRTGYDMDSVLQVSESIYQKLIESQKLGIIGSIWSPSQVLPSTQHQRQRQASLPSAKQLTRDVETALEGLPFRPAAFAPWIESVSASRDLKPLSYDAILSTPLGDILRQGLFQRGDRWIAVVRIGGVRSDAELKAWLDLQPDVKETHVEIKRATEHLLDEYRKMTFERLITVVIVLGAIVLIWSRSITRAVWILLPVGIGMLTGIAMPLLMGAAINVFHLLALLLVLGMGLDYSLFFNRAGDDELEQQQHLHAISISALTTSAAFSVLAFSSVPVLAGMGQTVSAGILACFLSSWVLACPQIEYQTEDMI